MTTTVDRRVVEIDVKTARGMQAEIKRAADSVGSLEKSLGGLKGVIAEFGAGLAASFTVGAFITAIKGSIDAMDEMGKRSQQVGITTEALSALTHQASLAGVEAQELDVGLVKLNSALADLGVESTAATKALAQLGVVAGTDTEQALAQIADQFSVMADGPQKTALAVDLFGKSGAKLIPMLNEGAAGIEKFRKEAERLGIVISKESAVAAEQFNDNVATLQAGIRGVTLQIAQGLVPALTQVTNSLEGTTESGERFKSFGEGLGVIVRFLTGTFLALWGGIQAVGRGLAAVASIMDALIERRFRAVGSILTDLATDIQQITAETVASIKKLSEPVVLPEIKTRTGTAPPKGLTEKELKEAKKAADELAKGWVAAIDEALGLTDAQNELAKSGKTVTETFIEENARLDELTGKSAAKKLAADVDLLTRAFDEGRIEVDDYMAAMQKLHGITEKTDDANKATTDSFLEMGKAIQASVEGWSSSAADAILDFATGAEQDVAKMVEGILRQFAKMAMQKLILDQMFAGFGGWMGGMFGGGAPVAPSARGNVFDAGGVTAFEKGGVVTQPTLFPFAQGVGLMGEAGPEAIMPLKRDAQGNLGVEGGGVTVNVVNQAGAEVDVASSKSANGEREITVTIQRAVADGFARGRFDGVMGATYGLSRRGN